MYIKKHKTLDKKLWLDSNQLIPDVRDMLMAITWDFVDYVRNKYDMDLRNQDVRDVILFGSTANYFYTKKSDIDVCVVFDIENVQKQYPNLNIMHTLKLYYYDWAMFHICNIHGRRVDLNFQPFGIKECGDRYRTGPNYSILNQQWVFEPVIVSDAQLHKIKHDAKIIYREILHDYKNVKRGGFKQNDVVHLYTKIINTRSISVHTSYEQTITPMYLAHREIKKRGIIDKLRDLSKMNEIKKFTLK